MQNVEKSLDQVFLSAVWMILVLGVSVTVGGILVAGMSLLSWLVR